MISQFFTSQFGRFLVTGGIAACVNLGSRKVYDVWTSYTVAIVLAYLTGMLTAYLLARKYVFVDATRTVKESAPRFVIVNGFGIAQTLIVSTLLATYVLPALGIVRLAEDIAHLVGVAVPAFTSFVGHRLWTFRDDASANDDTSIQSAH